MCLPAVLCWFLFVGLYDGVRAADWAMRWIGSDATFAERLVAFAAVEVSVRKSEDDCACTVLMLFHGFGEVWVNNFSGNLAWKFVVDVIADCRRS